jgi:hypothetical protein
MTGKPPLPDMILGRRPGLYSTPFRLRSAGSGEASRTLPGRARMPWAMALCLRRQVSAALPTIGAASAWQQRFRLRSGHGSSASACVLGMAAALPLALRGEAASMPIDPHAGRGSASVGMPATCGQARPRHLPVVDARAGSRRSIALAGITLACSGTGSQSANAAYDSCVLRRYSTARKPRRRVRHWRAHHLAGPGRRHGCR